MKKVINKIKYFFRRKTWQIRNVFRWLPVIWNQFDFDYSYSLEVFKFQLLKQAEFLESDKARTVSAKHNATRIRTAIKLMNKVYDEDYACEYQNKLREIYGEDVLDHSFEEFDEDSAFVELIWKYEKLENTDEIEAVKNKLFKESREKQEKAHRILWEFIAHNLRKWWD